MSTWQQRPASEQHSSRVYNNTKRVRHSAREVTPYPWECSALPSKYFKTRSLSRRLRSELLNKTWKMMSAAQRPRRRLLFSFFKCIFSRRKGIANLGEQRRSDVTEVFDMPSPARWGPSQRGNQRGAIRAPSSSRPQRDLSRFCCHVIT